MSHMVASSEHAEGGCTWIVWEWNKNSQTHTSKRSYYSIPSHTCVLIATIFVISCLLEGSYEHVSTSHEHTGINVHYTNTQPPGAVATARCLATGNESHSGELCMLQSESYNDKRTGDLSCNTTTQRSAALALGRCVQTCGAST